MQNNMPERIGFMKHLFDDEKKGKAAAAKSGSGETAPPSAPAEAPEQSGENMESLRIEAIDVLFAEYEALRKQAEEMVDKDITKATELVEAIDKKLDEIEALKDNDAVLIDDLEKIIARGGQNKRGGRRGEESDPDVEGVRTILEVTGKTPKPEGREVKVNMAELARYWNKFYKDNKVTWVEQIPEDIKLTEAQATEMKRQIEVLGFDWPVIIPAGLTGEPEYEEVEEEEVDEKTKKKVKVERLQLKKPAEHYKELHELMSEGYADKTFYGGNYDDDGGIGASVDKRHGLRIIMSKKAQELTEDKKLELTRGKSIDDLEAKGGIFEMLGVGGMTEAEYLIFQREYFQETENHLDVKFYAWLAASSRPRSGRVPDGSWNAGSERLNFDSNTTDFRDDHQGCRLAGSFLL